MAKLEYAALIPTLNRPQLLMRILKSLAVQTRPPAEVIIVDQSDDRETERAFENWNPPGVRKIYLKNTVKSLILARNRAFDECKTPLAAFFDDDLVLEKDYCEILMKVFEADTEKKLGGGMGTIQGSRFRWRPLERFFLMPHEGSGKFLSSGAPTYPHWIQSYSEVEFLSGGLTFWRREVFEKIRFDEALVGYGYGDDLDYSYRASRHFKLFYEPKAVCHHEEHAPGKDHEAVKQKVWIQNMYYLAVKNGFSRAAFFWFAIGHLYRDLIHLRFARFLGGLKGLRNIVTGHIDSVKGFLGAGQPLRQ
jgi:GT2 family glycosyltransferase